MCIQLCQREKVIDVVLEINRAMFFCVSQCFVLLKPAHEV